MTGLNFHMVDPDSRAGKTLTDRCASITAAAMRAAIRDAYREAAATEKAAAA